MEMVLFSGLYASTVDRELTANESNEFIENKALFQYLLKNGSRFNDERIALGAATRNLLSVNKPVTNKNLIYSLLAMLSCCDDAVTSDIIRHTLEIVVEFTEDDI